MKKGSLAFLVLLVAALTFSNVPGAFAQQIPLAGNSIPKYVDPLPVFGPASGGLAPRVSGLKKLTVTMKEFQQQILPASFYTVLDTPYKAGTYVWGYQIFDGYKTYGPSYPAFTIEAWRFIPTKVKYVNDLVNPQLLQFIKIDQTLHWADPLGQECMTQTVDCANNPNDPCCIPYAGPIPAVVHLHGGEVHSTSDGGPDAWFTPGNAQVGPAWSAGVTNNYFYPNHQEAATLFYHDHTLGATRIGVYAGMAGFYFIRGIYETLLNLPNGAQEIELAIQDRMFDTNGQLLFPNAGDITNPEAHPFWAPEFFGDAIVVNGKTWPYLDVKQRRYRFRIVNGSNARFYNLNFGTQTPAPAIYQIGTDGGLLDAAVKINQLLLAPGERADLIVDFAGIPAGTNIILYNDARAPYPTGDQADPSTVGQIMQFRVKALVGKDRSRNPALTPKLRIDPLKIVRLVPDNPITSAHRADRSLTLNEVMGAGGPLAILLNNTKWAGAITENPRVGSTEVWEIINLTADTHPIHLHLVQFQLLDRQAFNIDAYNTAYETAFFSGSYEPGAGPPPSGNPDVTPFLTGPPFPPAPNEAGWKDTVRMNPGEVTRIIVRWAPQDFPSPGPGPGFNRFPFDPTTGPGYVWHCHIVDHEDNEMMRPYTVSP